MSSPPGDMRLVALALAFGAALLAAGCANIFVPKHKVLVDAISAADAPQPSGLSYRLIAKRSVVNTAQAQVSVVKACVDAALSGVGMFEAPPNVPSDIFIEVSYGQDTTPRVDPAARETFLQLSGRANPARAIDRATGPELWDVRVAVLGIAGRVETAMPLLCAVAATYIGENTRSELKVDVPQNSKEIAAVRESAIRALEAKNPAAATAAAEPPPREQPR
jgi:hypothetical protein